MRERTRGTWHNITVNATERWMPADILYSGSKSYSNYPKKMETIIDEPNGKYSMRTKVVSHKKIENLIPGISKDDVGTLTGFNGLWTEYTRSPSKGFAEFSPLELESYDFGNPPPTQATLLKAFEDIVPTLQSGFNATVFVLELKELKTMLKLYDRMKSLFRNISNVTLGYSFGIKPFISDLKNLHEGISTFTERVERFKRESGIPNLKRRSRIISETQDDTGWFVVYGPSDWGPITSYCYKKVTRKITTTENFTFRYSYTIPHLSSDTEKLYAFLDTIGLHLDAAVLWELIPYSFVVDWFYPVGTILNRFRKDWFPATCNVQSCDYSRKTVQESRFYYRNWYEELGWDQLAIIRKVESYNRYPLSPSSFYNIDKTEVGLPRDLTLRQIILGAFLIEQRIPGSQNR